MSEKVMQNSEIFMRIFVLVSHCDGAQIAEMSFYISHYEPGTTKIKSKNDKEWTNDRTKIEQKKNTRMILMVKRAPGIFQCSQITKLII